jgi:hypothetical protein
VNAPTNGDQSSHSPPQENVGTPSAVDPGDQDIDTAATNAYDEFASERGDAVQEPTPTSSSSSAAAGDAVDNDAPPIGLHDPSSMPRAEDDATVLERSPEFNDRPGSGKYR